MVNNLDHDFMRLNEKLASSLCLNMIFPENRFASSSIGR